MNQENGIFAEAFSRHVGPGKTLSSVDVAGIARCSHDTVNRVGAGKSEAGFLLMHRLTRRVGSWLPLLCVDIAAAAYPGFRLERLERYERHELDANSDDRVDQLDALIFQADATEASAEKSKAILRREPAPAIMKFDTEIRDATAKASACIKTIAASVTR